MKIKIRQAFTSISGLVFAIMLSSDVTLAHAASRAHHHRALGYSSPGTNQLDPGYAADRSRRAYDGYTCQTDEGQGRHLPCDK